MLLYDLTSTYFESDPPFGEEDKRRFGYSRDHRSDCVQVVIALVITREGFPLAYEVMPGNTADNQTLRGFLEKMATIQMLDVHLPTTDGRELVLPRYTQPSSEVELLLNQLKLSLPHQPRPRISPAQTISL